MVKEKANFTIKLHQFAKFNNEKFVDMKCCKRNGKGLLLLENIPPEILYEVLATNRKTWVQYLPSSGMDLELCTGDPMDCPYGEYCSCGDEWEEKFNGFAKR